MEHTFELSKIKTSNVYPRIAIVDSGINLQHPLLAEYQFSGVGITAHDDHITITDDFTDKIGHGTAITSIIKKLIPDSEIFMVKIFDSELTVSDKMFMFALSYIADNVNCDILHMSLGMKMCNDLPELKAVCEKLKKKGVILVSSFDNEGSLSYPATLPNVIGVDQSVACKKDYDFEFVSEGGGVNVLAKGIGQKVAWVNPSYVLQSGSSYAAAYVTGFISNQMMVGITTHPDIMLSLKRQSKRVYEVGKYKEVDQLPNIKRAICFPFNKETHSLIRFADLLPFELHTVYDTKYGGKLNRDASDFIGKNIHKNYVIQDYKQINWEDDSFDSVILSHTDALTVKTGEDYQSYFIEHCLLHNKLIYSFDRINLEGTDLDDKIIYYPEITSSHLPASSLGKLRYIGKPILGIFGTSPHQGKLTLQLKFRRLLIAQGYSVGQLGTEPSSLLYGFDFQYPMGYNSAVDTSGFEAIRILNHLMGKIEDRNPDIIIVGSQSGTIPYSFSNLNYYTTPQIEFLLGTRPDVIALCVNADDDLNYVKRTISTLESMVASKVIGLVIFPYEKEISLLQGYKYKEIHPERRAEIKQKFQQELNRESYFLDIDDEIMVLWDSIASYLQ
ncbi:S8 family serine peptidase [Paenibacillus sp. FSL W7-1287]|uniref:S8 family serine peptidase n=1 Tax=Paenibacillus sp. FSL W7-1287 TaxID=2954538 RepID=UPI0030FC1AE5